MIPLARIKEKLQFNNNLDNIINTLKIVASLNLRQFQQKEASSGVFLKEIASTLGLLSERATHPLLDSTGRSGTLYVVITSNEGFLGGLNTLLVNAALNDKKAGDAILVIGSRGQGYLSDIGEPYLVFEGLEERIEYTQIYDLKRYLVKEYLAKKLSRVVMVYPKYISVTFQQVTREKILPFSLSEQPSVWDRGEILFDSSYNSLIEGLVGLGLDSLLAHIFHSSKLSEFSARLMHLEKCSQELAKTNRDLFWQYFKSLHASIDKSIREIFASRMLWRTQ